MKKTISLVMMTILFTFPAQASMQDALNSMFQANVTTPGAYKSATRGGFVGGGIEIRTPVKPINLMAFDPPRISMGCGGIDMYGGSFSFINSDQFTTLLRTIMNNAIGLLFQAALKAIDPGISDLLNSFQKMVQDMNALASNTCAIANQTINSFKSGSIDTEVKQAAAKVATDAGNVADQFTGLFPKSNVENKTVNQNAEAQNPSAGNFTWRALSRSQVADSVGAVGMVTDPSDPNGDIPKYFLMSLIGTNVVTSFATESNPANSNVPTAADPRAPTLTLQDLINPSSVKLWSCSGAVTPGDSGPDGPNSCTTVTPIDLDFAGTKFYVQNMLFGDSTQTTTAGMRNAVDPQTNPSAYTPENPGPNSIYGKITNCSGAGCGLSAPEQSFLLMAGPVFKLMKDAQSDPAAMRGLSKYIEDPLAYMIAEKLGEATIRAARGAWNGVKDVQMPDYVAKNINQLNIQLATLQSISAQYNDNLSKAADIANNIRKNFPAMGVQ